VTPCINYVSCLTLQISNFVKQLFVSTRLFLMISYSTTGSGINAHVDCRHKIQLAIRKQWSGAFDCLYSKGGVFFTLPPVQFRLFMWTAECLCHVLLSLTNIFVRTSWRMKSRIFVFWNMWNLWPRPAHRCNSS